MAAKKQKKVIQFQWQGLNQKRATVSGELEAPSVAQARAVLRQRGIVIKKIKRKPKPLFSSRAKPIKSEDISFASRQMATMISAGIPIAQTLKGIGTGHENASLEKLMLDLAKDVESGSSLSSSLSKYPVHFSRLFTSLTQAGEESGKLDTMLDRVATYNEKLEAIKSKIKSAMLYPIIVLVVAAIVTILLLLFVIPQFEALFKGVGADLPALTRTVVTMSEWMQEYWWVFFGIVIVAGISFVEIYKRSEKFKFALDRVVIRLPVLGEIMRKSALARFARTLAIIFSAGVPLVDGMATVGSATGNRVYEKGTLDIKNEVSTGKALAISMEETKLFPNMMLQMVASGEESGELEVMLEKVADFFEREVDDAVESLASIIEPVMIVMLGTIIGTMVLAMYMPIFQLGNAF